MIVEYYRADQALQFASRARSLASETVHEITEHYPIATRFTGLILGIGDALLTIASSIAELVECVFKGFANLFGNSEDYSVKRGIKQLTIGVPYQVANVLVISPLQAVFRLFSSIIGMALDPKDYTSAKDPAINLIRGREGINSPTSFDIGQTILFE